MKKIIIIISIFFLILVTTITKNSTKKLENQIFSIRENLNVLKNQYELILLDYNILSSPQKLMDYQIKYFENELVVTDINKIKEVIIEKDNLEIMNLNKKNYENK
jgi:hypothetical protein|tara:strand:+ start:944 stop:1258 length:315 start_codon:yes stop_codon:yes gene_type:complete